MKFRSTSNHSTFHLEKRPLDQKPLDPRASVPRYLRPHFMFSLRGAVLLVLTFITLVLAGREIPRSRHARISRKGSFLSNSTTSSRTPFVNVNSTNSTTTSHSLPTTLPTTTSSSTSLTSSSTSVSTTSPAPVAVPSPTEPSSDLQTVLDRRLPFIISSLSAFSSVDTWLQTLSPNGTWPDVDYTSGCTAQRASWPAQAHWQRTNTLAAAYHGASSLGNYSMYTDDPDVRAAISLAMDWWFANDYTNLRCQDFGGNATYCPCGTPGLWNPNWYSNLIGVARSVGQTCLLLLQKPDGLTPTQYGNCTKFTTRSFNTFTYSIIGGVGTLTGANTLDVASIGVAAGLLLGNDSIVADAYQRVHNEVVVQTALMSDGIKADGSFSQHTGVLYPGNYGKDYANDVLQLELQAADTPWQAGNVSRSTFAGYVDGFQWSIVLNNISSVLHWDVSVIGRFISMAVSDKAASASINLNLTEIDVLGDTWGVESLSDTAQRLEFENTAANAGDLYGNRMFWENDYMVHRGVGYVTTLKMFSNRTKSSECLNSQNPFGFHLSDGTVYNYQSGYEYEDIVAAWDWNLVPGITTDYGATPLSCSSGIYGVENFVGGVSDGSVGVAAMRYTNPITRTFAFQKAWFFFNNDVQQVAGMAFQPNNSSYTTRHVLDQKRRNGDVYVDGNLSSGSIYPLLNGTTVWHDQVGYYFGSNVNGTAGALNVSLPTSTGSWQPLGISTHPPSTVDFFVVSLDQSPLQADKRVSYTTFPNITQSSFMSSIADAPVTVQNDVNITAVLHGANCTIGIVFWNSIGGEIVIQVPNGGMSRPAYIRVTSDQAVTLILHFDDEWSVSVADPTQTLTTVNLLIQRLGSWQYPLSPSSRIRIIQLSLPQDQGFRGSSVQRSFGFY